jgi:hypothetical protein
MLDTSNPKIHWGIALQILRKLPSLLETHVHGSNTTNGKRQNQGFRIQVIWVSFSGSLVGFELEPCSCIAHMKAYARCAGEAWKAKILLSL